jgi:hypothetical protein
VYQVPLPNAFSQLLLTIQAHDDHRINLDLVWLKRSGQMAALMMIVFAGSAGEPLSGAI